MKCRICKLEKHIDEFTRNGKEYKSCNTCIKKKQCPCGKEKRRCKKHGGSNICKVCDKRKDYCKCNPDNVCECNILKRECRTHGNRYCECGKPKTLCDKHGGGGLCECGKPRSFCSKHGGGGLCSCGKVRHDCKLHGSRHCTCGKQRRRCKIHGGSGICKKCNTRNDNCKCNLNNVCECNILKRECRIHGDRYCECNKKKTLCDKHGGGGLCGCGRQKALCVIHSESRMCDCGRQKYTCKTCSPIGHLVSVVRSRVNNALKRASITKKQRSVQYLGCTGKFYRSYLEAKFQDDMTWENHGSVWHIDHIIPIMYNNPTKEEVIERLHYTNTQPLYVFDNLSKNNNWVG